MHDCSAFDPGIYSANIVLDILSHTPPCHLTDESCNQTPSLPISIDLRQQTKMWPCATLDAHVK